MPSSWILQNVRTLRHGRTRTQTLSDNTSSSPVILDRFVHRSDRDANNPTASATSYTCTGRPIRASLRLAVASSSSSSSPTAAAVSRLHLHWPAADRPEFIFAARRLPEPLVIAADAHAILLRAIVPFEDPACCDDTCRFPVDLFVYSAFTSPPALRRLPACFVGGVSTPDEDFYFKPYRRRQQRTMVADEVGILCHGGDGDFTVVDFTNFGRDGELCILHHHHHNNNTDEAAAEWMLKKVMFPKGTVSAHYWVTDAIVPVQEKFLCWVDCYQGILVVDVLLVNDKNTTKDHELTYIALPEEALQQSGNNRPDPDGDCPDPARRVCVTANGMPKLICIITSTGKARSAFTIKSWTLSDIVSQRRWLKCETMEAAEFWGLYNGRSLPLVKPMFPLVSLVHPDVIYFLLKEDHKTSWIIQVDMREKVLKSASIYMNEEEEGCTTDRARRNVFDGHCC